MPLESSQVFQISLPSGFEGQSYGELVQFLLLEKDILPLGLYRMTLEESGIGNSGYNRYVHTNPKPSDILRNYDLVFVISLKDPRDTTGPTSPPPLPHPDYTL